MTTGRGTTHLFPIHPCGGPINRKSHASGNVGNQPSVYSSMSIDVAHANESKPQAIHAFARVKVHAYDAKKRLNNANTNMPSTIPCTAIFRPFAAAGCQDFAGEGIGKDAKDDTGASAPPLSLLLASQGVTMFNITPEVRACVCWSFACCIACRI